MDIKTCYCGKMKEPIGVSLNGDVFCMDPDCKKTIADPIEKFKKQREELKDWLEGTIHKQYDREETVEVIREDVDRYFSDEWITDLLKEVKQ